MNTYGEAASCIDDLIYYEIKAECAMRHFYESVSVDNSKSDSVESDKQKQALGYALMQHSDVSCRIEQLQRWVRSDAPEIKQYGNAKQFFNEKKQYNMYLCLSLGSIALGAVGLLFKEIPVVVSGLAMSGMSFILAESYKPVENDKRFSEDLKKYESDRSKYNLEYNFGDRDINNLVKSLDSYIPAVQNVIDKLSPKHIRNCLPNDDLNDIINTYIGLNLFKKNAQVIMDILGADKNNSHKKKIVTAISDPINVSKEPQFTI